MNKNMDARPAFIFVICFICFALQSLAQNRTLFCDSVSEGLGSNKSSTQWFLPFRIGQGPLFFVNNTSSAYTASLHLLPTFGIGTNDEYQFRLGPDLSMMYTNPAVELFAGGQLSYQLKDFSGLFKLHIIGDGSVGSRNHTLIGTGLIASVGELVDFSLTSHREVRDWSFTSFEAGVGFNLFSLLGIETRSTPTTVDIHLIDKSNYFSHVQVMSQQKALTCLDSSAVKQSLMEFLKTETHHVNYGIDTLTSKLRRANLSCLADKVKDILDEATKSIIHEAGYNHQIAADMADEPGIVTAIVIGFCKASALAEH